MHFSKWHALGNSYLVVEQPDAGALKPARVQRLCSVETGIGSDGVLEVTRRDGAYAVVTIWNPDGSIAEMSGNGTRIAARWLAAESGATEVTIETAGRRVSAGCSTRSRRTWTWARSPSAPSSRSTGSS